MQQLLTAGLLFAAATVAPAGIIYDTNLVSPNGSSAPGWYNGTGNPNGGFTVDSENGIEIGLRAKLRQSPNVIHSPDNQYTVPTGSQPGVPGRAAWNYEFSIDLEPLGAGSLTLADIVASLTITDVTTGQTSTVNPLTYWNDDTGFGSLGTTKPESAAQWGAQNSQNPIFGDFPLAFEYNMNAVRTYRLDLVINNLSGGNLATDTILINTVSPEPASLALFASGVAVIGLIRRKRNKN